MHFIALVFLAANGIENFDQTFAQDLGKWFYLRKGTDPDTVFFTKLIHVIGHGLCNQDGQIRSLAAHIGFEFFNPVAGEPLSTLAFINNLPAFLSELIADSLDTIRTADALANFCHQVEGEIAFEHFFQGQFLHFALQLHTALFRFALHFFGQFFLVFQLFFQLFQAQVEFRFFGSRFLFFDFAEFFRKASTFFLQFPVQVDFQFFLLCFQFLFFP